jgi:predicted metal-dependent peptidase
MNVLDRIRKSHVSIMWHKKFCAFSGVLACGTVEVTEDIPTACTNGWDRKYNPKFVKEHAKLDSELRFLVLHEAMHVAYRHLHTWRELFDENPQLANIAADYFVNLALVVMDDGEGFITMPKVGVMPYKKYLNWSVRQVFDDLKKNPPPSGNGGGLDEHEWEEAAGSTPAEQAMQVEGIQRALRQGEMMQRKLAGKGSGNSAGLFGDLLAPKIDWRKVLRDFITETCAGCDESTWSRPNRRFLSEDTYMPSMLGTTMTELVILFDTSASCFGGAEMTRFVSELTAIVNDIKPSKCHVLYVDTAVAGHQTFEEGQFAVQNLKPYGGGGTELPVAFGYLADKRIQPQAMVVLTDGYTPFGTAPSYPVLWAMTSSQTAPYGTTINLGD